MTKRIESLWFIQPGDSISLREQTARYNARINKARAIGRALAEGMEEGERIQKYRIRKEAERLMIDLHLETTYEDGVKVTKYKPAYALNAGPDNRVK